MMRNDNTYDSSIESDDIMSDSEYFENNPPAPVKSCVKSAIIRDKFAEYFNTAGAVEWQYDMVNRK